MQVGIQAEEIAAAQVAVKEMAEENTQIRSLLAEKKGDLGKNEALLERLLAKLFLFSRARRTLVYFLDFSIVSELSVNILQKMKMFNFLIVLFSANNSSC